MPNKVPDGKKPNDYQTTLPTAPDQHNDQGSFKITLPTSKKYSRTENT